MPRARVPETTVATDNRSDARPPEAPLVVIHHHHHEAPPVSITSEEGAQRWLDMPHRRLIYTRLGVAITELPNERFAVLVADVEQALRDAGVKSPPRLREKKREDGRMTDDEFAAILARAGIRLVPEAERKPPAPHPPTPPRRKRPR